MAYVAADKDALKAAFASGAQSVRTADGREVTYRSVAEFERLLALMDRDILAATATPPSRLVRVGVRSGVTA